MDSRIIIEQKKMEIFREMKRRFPDFCTISQDKILSLSLSQIEEAKISAEQAVRTGELIDVTKPLRSQRNGAGLSLRQQAANEKDWINYDEDEDFNRSSSKIIFK